MNAISRRHLGALTAAGALGALITACGSDAGTGAADGSTETIEIEDNHGTVAVPAAPASVVATDNRTFETLDTWGIELSAAPLALMPAGISYKENPDIVDLGNHREPNLEAVVAVEPDLIINGQRFMDFRDDFAKLVPDAALVDLDPREGEDFASELKRQTTVLGEIFGKQDEAAQLCDALDAAIERAKAAYSSDDSVMAVTTSGGEIGYIAPTVGRTLGPVFDILGLSPALEVAGASDDHQGDDISVEAIAKANPDWMLVMDRDAAISADDPSYEPAAAVLEKSEALTSVTAVSEGNIVYMPSDTYTNEGIQTYTEFFETLADAFEKKA